MSKDLLAHLVRPSQKHPRKHVSETLKANNWEELNSYLVVLESTELENMQDIEFFIEAWSEISSIVKEEGARLYINMTCFTDNQDNAMRFSEFVEEIEPRLAPIWDRLNRKIIESPLLADLDPYYNIWLRSIQNEIHLFREQNVPIETKIALELQAYQQVTGSMSVEHEGQTLTLAQFGLKLESNDRAEREMAWKKIWARRLQDKDTLNNHFHSLFQMRHQISENCGYSSFLDYIFKAKGRFDYTPTDCQNFHNAIEKHIVPKYRALLKERAQMMGLDRLKPWDLACDANGLSPLTPFKNSQELIAKNAQIFKNLDAELGEYFQTMIDQKLLDLDARLGKAPGGYQTTLDELRLPFIFMNAVGSNGDIYTLLHEGGHSFHQFLMNEQRLSSYRDIDAEIAEVASMSMELLGQSQLDIYYNPAESARARIDQFEDILRLLPWVAIVDSFQMWMYSNPNHTLEERTQKWLELDNRFGAGDIVDWTGLEEERAYSWQRQLHIFEVPFYYIEYGIAQLGALQIYQNFKTNPQGAIQKYKTGLKLGSSRPLPELFEAVGAKFEFNDEIVAPLAELVWKELQAELEVLSSLQK
jgi:oligoendopeptidase F